MAGLVAMTCSSSSKGLLKRRLGSVRGGSRGSQSAASRSTILSEQDHCLDGLIHDAEDVLVTFPTSLTLFQMYPTPLPTLDATDVAMVDVYLSSAKKTVYHLLS